jgi:hypothetical protein
MELGKFSPCKLFLKNQDHVFHKLSPQVSTYTSSAKNKVWWTFNSLLLIETQLNNSHIAKFSFAFCLEYEHTRYLHMIAQLSYSDRYSTFKSGIVVACDSFGRHCVLINQLTTETKANISWTQISHRTSGQSSVHSYNPSNTNNLSQVCNFQLNPARL